MIRFLSVAFFGLLAIAVPALFGATTAPVAAASAASVPLIEPASLNALKRSGAKITLVDVRQPEEYNQGHIQGAVLMPLGTLPSKYATLPKTGKLVIYCRSGKRSAQAVEFLLTHGYGRAVSLNGGYLAWTAGGFK